MKWQKIKTSDAIRKLRDFHNWQMDVSTIWMTTRRPCRWKNDVSLTTFDQLTHDSLDTWQHDLHDLHDNNILWNDGHMTMTHDLRIEKSGLGVKDPRGSSYDPRLNSRTGDWGHLFSRCSIIWHWLMTATLDSRTATLAKTSTNMWEMTQDKFCIERRKRPINNV